MERGPSTGRLPQGQKQSTGELVKMMPEQVSVLIKD